MTEWLQKCEALVPNPTIWAMLAEWDWHEAWTSEVTPDLAVHTALLDVFAPTIGERWPMA